jgi:hypothetical protein
MALDIRRRTVRDDAALIETHNAIRNAHHHLHVMLYEKNVTSRARIRASARGWQIAGDGVEG